MRTESTRGSQAPAVGDASLPRIGDRLAGQRLLVTGATGFLAKALVEKLLRSVHSVEAIYLLIRPSADGLSPSARADRDVLNNRAFDRLRASLGPAFRRLCDAKIRVIGGDLTRDRLGLSPGEYAELTKQITCVVNSAATVTFDERLDWAIDLNALGPSRLLRVAQDCGNVPFLHVSTCYVCGAREGVIVEDFSAPERARESLPREPVSGAYDLERLLAELNTEAAEVRARNATDSERCRQELIDAGMRLARRHGWNDTYTFTKWIGEQLLLRDRGGVPLVVFRPAIIEGSWDEPLPGWIDGLRMADPVIVAYGRGKLREFPGKPETVIDFIPVDFVVNAMLAALPIGVSAGAIPPVLQCATSDSKPLDLRDMCLFLQRAFQKRPMSDETGRPVIPTRLRLVDTEAFLATWRRKQQRLEWYSRMWRAIGAGDGKARRHRAISRQIDQILYFAKIYAPYTYQNRRFADDGLQRLAGRLHPDDRAAFPFLATAINWEEYLVERHVPGVRSFVLGSGGEPDGRLRSRDANARPQGTPGPGPLQSSTLFDVFQRSAMRAPEKPALQIRRDGRWVRYSYRDALDATGAIMQRFLEFGLRPGDRLCLSSENGPEWGLSYLAAMRTGLTVVPLDPQLQAAEAWHAARFVEAKLMCAGTTTSAALSAARDSTDAPLVTLREPIVPPPGASRDQAPRPVPATDGDIASILFTSGTTVTPRAVPLTHRNFVSNARALLEVHPIHATDEFLSVLPLYHVFEFMAGLVVPMAVGATVTYVDQLKSPEILAAMQATGTTVMLVVPRLMQVFHDSIERQVAAAGPVKRGAWGVLSVLSSWTGHRLAKHFFKPVHSKFGGRLRMFVSGGSALDPELWHAFRRLGFTVHEGYGMTETSPVLTVTPPGAAKPGSVGPPLPNVELEVRNQNLEGIGEIWVRGPSVMSGYLNNDDATRETLVEDWLRTGDLGRRDEDGYVYLTGRSKDLIVTAAGKNVYPDELEVHYRDLPYIKELCVFGTPVSGGLGDEVHAVAVIDPDKVMDLDRSSVEREIRLAGAAIGDALPTHQRIGTFHFWDRDLPKTSTLKAKRGLIREMATATGTSAAFERVLGKAAAGTGASAREPDAVAQDPAFMALQEALARISKRPAHSIRKDMHLLLDLGIDSIGKIDLLGAVEAQFGIRIDDEAGARIARVGDLVALIGDRALVADHASEASTWRRWFTGRGSASTNGHAAAPLLPMRWLLRGLGSALLHSFVRVHAAGRENLPATGSFILAPNHASHLDSPAVLVAAGGRRRIWVAAAEDYFFNTAAKRLVFGQLLDAIAFDRKADGLEGLRRCAAALERGDGLLIFPEGTRSLTGRMQPFRLGVAALALERQVPIIPVHIENAFELLPKGHRLPRPGMVSVRFGKPIFPPRPGREAEHFEACAALTRQVQEAVASLAGAAAL